MNVLIVLTYYRPHTSGLTIYAERLAQGLVARGHRVTVLTSRYSRQLPSMEEVDGVRVVRAPVALRISKGVIMPTFGYLAWKYVREADVISLLHAPQFDAAGVALRGKLLHKPTLLTYHCDRAASRSLQPHCQQSDPADERSGRSQQRRYRRLHARLRRPFCLPAEVRPQAARHLASRHDA